MAGKEESPAVQNEGTFVLYAKPNEEKPYVTIASLQKGEYQECSYYSIRYFIPMSDVGKIFFDTIKEVVSDVEVKLENVNFLENNHEYEIYYKAKDFTILLKSNRYRAFPFSYVKTFFLKFEISGSVQSAQPVFSKFISKIGKLPVEFDDWQKLSAKIGKTKEEVEKDWKTMLTVQKVEEGKKTLSKLSTLLDEVDNIPDL